MRIKTNAYGMLKVHFHASGSMDGAKPKYYYIDSLELENGQHLVNGDIGFQNRLFRDVFQSKRELAATVKSAL